MLSLVHSVQGNEQARKEVPEVRLHPRPEVLGVVWLSKLIPEWVLYLLRHKRCSACMSAASSDGSNNLGQVLLERKGVFKTPLAVCCVMGNSDKHS